MLGPLEVGVSHWLAVVGHCVVIGKEKTKKKLDTLMATIKLAPRSSTPPISRK